MRPTKLPATPSPAVAEVTQLEKRWLTFLPNAGTRTIPESGGPRPLVVNKGLEILILPPQLGDGGVALLQRCAQALDLRVRCGQLLRRRLHHRQQGAELGGKGFRELLCPLQQVA